jgi:hypothetical protein
VTQMQLRRDCGPVAPPRQPVSRKQPPSSEKGVVDPMAEEQSAKASEC